MVATLGKNILIPITCIGRVRARYQWSGRCACLVYPGLTILFTPMKCTIGGLCLIFSSRTVALRRCIGLVHNIYFHAWSTVDLPLI